MVRHPSELRGGRRQSRKDESEIACYDNIIEEHWGCTAREAFPASFYNPREELSEDCMKALCKIAQATNYMDGKQTIIDTKKGISAPYLSITLLNAVLASYTPAQGYARGRESARGSDIPSALSADDGGNENGVDSFTPLTSRYIATEVPKHLNSVVPFLGSSVNLEADVERFNDVTDRTDTNTSTLDRKPASAPQSPTIQEIDKTSLRDSRGSADGTVETILRSSDVFLSNKTSESDTHDANNPIHPARPHAECPVSSEISYNGDYSLVPKARAKQPTMTVPTPQPLLKDDSLSGPLQTLIAATRKHLDTFKDFNERRNIWLDLIRTAAEDFSTIAIAYDQSELATFFWTYPSSLTSLGVEAQREWQHHAQIFFRLDTPPNSSVDRLRFSNTVIDPAPVIPNHQGHNINDEKQTYKKCIHEYWGVDSSKILPKSIERQRKDFGLDTLSDLAQIAILCSLEVFQSTLEAVILERQPKETHTKNIRNVKLQLSDIATAKARISESVTATALPSLASTKTLANAQQRTTQEAISILSPSDANRRPADKLSCVEIQSGQGYKQVTGEPRGSRENTSSELKGAKSTAKAEIDTENHVAVRSGSDLATDSAIDDWIAFLASEDQPIPGTQDTADQRQGSKRKKACTECRKVKQRCTHDEHGQMDEVKLRHYKEKSPRRARKQNNDTLVAEVPNTVPTASIVNDGPKVIEDLVSRSSPQRSNSPVMTPLKRKADWDGPENKKYQKSAESLLEAPPAYFTIHQSELSPREVLGVDQDNNVISTEPPTNDLEGALESLRGWLSTEAIQRVLEVCADSSYRILDGAYLSAAFLDQKGKPSVRLQPHERTVIAPICYRDHWTLAVISLDKKRVCHYDSLGLPSEEIKTVTLAFAKRLNRVDEWKFDDMVFMRENRHHREGFSSLLQDYETVYQLLHDLSIKKNADDSRLRDQLTQSTKDMDAFESLRSTLLQISPEFRLALEKALEESQTTNEIKLKKVKRKQDTLATRLNQLQVVMSRVRSESSQCYGNLATISSSAKVWLEDSSRVPTG
ncbi:MAG: hypothetical protein Q9170_003181 [Blastenia crenularia]